MGDPAAECGWLLFGVIIRRWAEKAGLTAYARNQCLGIMRQCEDP